MVKDGEDSPSICYNSWAQWIVDVLRVSIEVVAYGELLKTEAVETNNFKLIVWMHL